MKTRKFLALMLALVSVISLCACGHDMPAGSDGAGDNAGVSDGADAETPEKKGDSTAEKIAKAITKAADELDEQDECITANCILSSSASMNCASSNGKVDFERTKMFTKKYFADLDQYKYFAFIRWGQCEYCVVENNGVLDVYPDGKLIKSISAPSEYDDINVSDYSFEQLYQKCKGYIS